VTKARLEAFSDGVLAIIITIMVLELKIPHEPDVAALRERAPIFVSYVLSFVFIGIYWNNHHHLVHAAPRVSGRILWANLHLLFWLSLVPFTTGWLGEHHEAAWPTALYGAVLFMAGVAYVVLQTLLLRQPGTSPKVAQAFQRDLKGPASAALYAAAIGLAFVNTILSDVLYVAVALLWLIPDRRIERALASE
jgi:uncharacterized membrane protein